MIITAVVYGVAFAYVLGCGIRGYRIQKRIDAELVHVARDGDPF